MRTFITGFAAIALLITSCAKNEIKPDTSAANEINFGAASGVASKGTVTDNGSIQGATAGFGINAYYTGTADFLPTSEPSTGTFIFMRNQPVTYDATGGLWSYTPKKYWPNAEGDKLSFFAYAPYNATTLANGGIRLNHAVAGTAGWPSYTFDVTDIKPDQMVDFVVDQKLNLLKQTTNIHFVLKHITTRAGFFVNLDKNVTTEQAGDGETYVMIKEIRMKGNKIPLGGQYNTNPSNPGWQSVQYTGKDYTIPTDFNTANPAPWNEDAKTILTAAAGNYPSKDAHVLPLQGDGEENILGTGQYLFFIPIEGGIQAEGDVVVEFDYDIVTKDAQIGNVGDVVYTSTNAVVSLPKGTLQEEKAYKYIFTIGITEVKVSANVEDWTEEIVVPVPKAIAASASQADILQALNELNPIKAAGTNWNYFTVIIKDQVSAFIDLSSWANGAVFYQGDIIELDFQGGTTGGYTVTPPTGWEISIDTLFTSTHDIIPATGGKLFLRKKS